MNFAKKQTMYDDKTRYNMHFGDSDLVISHDFKTVISDFVNPYEYYEPKEAEPNQDECFLPRNASDSIANIFIQQRSINKSGGAPQSKSSKVQSHQDIQEEHNEVKNASSESSRLLQELMSQVTKTKGSGSSGSFGEENSSDQSMCSGQLHSIGAGMKTLAKYSLNGDAQADSVTCVVQLKNGGRFNSFAEDKLTRVKRVEVWTFEKQFK